MKPRALLSGPSSPSLPLLFLFLMPATAAIYTLSLHDALPICGRNLQLVCAAGRASECLCSRRHRSAPGTQTLTRADRKSTRLNSSHTVISYAVFCLKKKKPSTLSVECLIDVKRDRKSRNSRQI